MPVAVFAETVKGQFHVKMHFMLVFGVYLQSVETEWKN